MGVILYKRRLQDNKRLNEFVLAGFRDNPLRIFSEKILLKRLTLKVVLQKKILSKKEEQ